MRMKYYRVMYCLYALENKHQYDLNTGIFISLSCICTPETILDTIFFLVLLNRNQVHNVCKVRKKQWHCITLYRYELFVFLYYVMTLHHLKTLRFVYIPWFKYRKRIVSHCFCLIAYFLGTLFLRLCYF